MRRLIVSIAALSLLLLLISSTDTSADPRRGILEGRQKVKTSEEEEEPPPLNHWFSIGTLTGASIAFDDVHEYEVRDNVIYYKHKGTFADRLSPTVYLLPSITILNFGGRSLAALLPLGATADGDVSPGIGMSLAFHTVRRGAREENAAEIGLAVALVWSPRVYLSELQKESLAKGTALPPGTPAQIEERMEPSISIGVYVLPLF